MILATVPDLLWTFSFIFVAYGFYLGWYLYMTVRRNVLTIYPLFDNMKMEHVLKKQLNSAVICFQNTENCNWNSYYITVLIRTFLQRSIFKIALLYFSTCSQFTFQFLSSVQQLPEYCNGSTTIPVKGFSSLVQLIGDRLIESDRQKSKAGLKKLRTSAQIALKKRLFKILKSSNRVSKRRIYTDIIIIKTSFSFGWL